MHGSVTIHSAVGVVDFSNGVFNFFFLSVIIRFSFFKIIVVCIWADSKLSQKPSKPKFLVVFLNKSISR